jgi:signal transduction histidine kinase
MDRRRGPVSRYFTARPRLVSILLTAGLGLSFLFQIVVMGHHPVDYLWQNGAIVALQGLGIAAIWWRDRYPLGVFIAVFAADLLTGLINLSVPDGSTLGGTMTSLVTIYAVAKWYPHRTTWICAALLMAFAGMLLMGLSSQQSDFLILLLLGLTLTFSMYLVVIMFGFRARRELLHQRDVRAWAQAQSSAAQLEERARIAREMHDVVAHSLTVMITLADGARVTTRKNPERGMEIMADVAATGRAALADMRRVLGVLKGEGSDDAAPLAPMPSMDAIPRLIEGFKSAGLPVMLVQAGERWPEDSALQQTVYRIVQESLTNVLRYGRSASRVTVELRAGPEGFRVAVSDNGLGASSTPVSGSGTHGTGFQGSGNGLTGLATRVGAFGGRFAAGPIEPNGWRVEALFPPPAASTPDPRTTRRVS